MLQRRFREQERGGNDDDDDENEKSGKKKKKGGGRGGDLRIHDLEEDLEMSSDDSDSSLGDGKKKEPALLTDARPRFHSACHHVRFPFSTHLFIGQTERVRQSRRKTQGKEKQRRRRRERAATKRPWRTAMTATTRVSRWITCRMKAGQIRRGVSHEDSLFVYTRQTFVLAVFLLLLACHSVFQSSSEEEPEKGKIRKGEDHPKGQAIRCWTSLDHSLLKRRH